MRISDWSSDVCSSDLFLHALDIFDRLRGQVGIAARARGRFAPAVHFLIDRLDRGLIGGVAREIVRSEEHTSELQSLMRISYAVFCLKKTNNNITYSQKTYYQN